MPVGIEAWIFQIPPITRGWLILSVLTSLAVVSSFSVYASSVELINLLFNCYSSNVNSLRRYNCTLAPGVRS
jgi:hypothetical protein